MSLMAKIKCGFKIMNIKMVLLLILTYSAVYSVLSALLMGAGLKNRIVTIMIPQMALTVLVVFGSIVGARTLSVFYIMTSFGWERKKSFGLWSTMLGISVLLNTLINALLFFLGSVLSGGGKEIMDFVPWLTIAPAANIGAMVAAILLIIGCSLLLMLVISFFSILGWRYDWQITTGMVLLVVALFLLTFVANINILILTGSFLYYYVAGVYAASALLYVLIYILSQKLEVKN